MPLNERINLKLYGLLTIISNLVLSYFIPFEIKYILCLVVIAIAVSANHLMLGTAVIMMTRSAASSKDTTPVGKKLAFIFIGKFAVLGGTLVIGIHFMDDLVIIPLISYIIQLGILIASLKRDRS